MKVFGNETKNTNCGSDAIHNQEQVVCHSGFLKDKLLRDLDALFNAVAMHFESCAFEQTNVSLSNARCSVFATSSTFLGIAASKMPGNMVFVAHHAELGACERTFLIHSDDRRRSKVSEPAFHENLKVCAEGLVGQMIGLLVAKELVNHKKPVLSKENVAVGLHHVIEVRCHGSTDHRS